MKTQQMEQLDVWAGRILVALAVGTFALSYAGMYSVAVAAGYAWLAWLWPLVTEAAVGIFSLLYLYAKLRGYQNRWLMPLILGGTAVSVIFNVWHAPQPDALSRSVVAVPPLLFFAAFKALVWKVEEDVRRDGLVETLADMLRRMERSQADFDKLAGDLAARQTELERSQAAHDRLNADIDRLKAEHLTHQQKAGAIQADIDRLKAERQRLKTEPAPVLENGVPVRDRAAALLAEHGPDVSGAFLAAQLGTSEGYARKLKRELGSNRN